MDNIIEIKGLSYYRGERPIYKNIDLNIPRGKITAIMGPSGTGKTTLLRLIGGQLKPNTGQILFEGQDVVKMSRRDLFHMRQSMGLLFQSGALFSELSVFDNVAFALREHTRLPESIIRQIVLMKLNAVGLRGARDLMPAELSGGMSRRAALARSIALDPALMMYDEPFAGQDPIAMGVLVRLIRTLNNSLGLTSIVVSHDVPEVSSIADYIYIVANGYVIGHGTPEELGRSEEPRVEQFIQGLADGPVPFHFPASSYSDDILMKDHS
ncbi:MAG: ATP-binding cassette domain-containing protein [Pseudomonadota bacterium]